MFIATNHRKMRTSGREPLLKGKHQYSSAPCIKYFRAAALDNANIYLLFYKTGYLNEETYCTELSISVSVPDL
jgi:hypothetical protein